MGEGEWALAALHDVVVAAAPDREMLVCGGVRRTYAEVAARSKGLAAFLVERGVTVHRERGELERWEKGQDAVALVLHNGAEYVEAMLGAYRARAVPFNVNQHYRPAEMGALLADLDTSAVVYHRRYGPLVAAALGPGADVVLIDVDDGSGVASLPGSTPYEDAVATTVGAATLPTPDPDDLYILCTGGTTGTPKAVLWRQADVYVSAMGGAEGMTAEALAAAVAGRPAGPWFPVAPLMHGAAQWTAFAAIHAGAPVLLHDDSAPFDPAAILALAAAEGAFLLQTVGDAHVRPLVDELARDPARYDLRSVRVLGTGGAATSDHLKDALLDHLPELTIMDGYGASETGGMAYGASTSAGRAEGFSPSAGATVISADRTRVLGPGDDEFGWTARRGRVPLGYLGDRERTEATFPIVDGARVAVPGDRAQLLADGSIRMLGRDSMVVNTGGEKVFVEEVEEVLRAHPAVADALVVGRPSDRFGQEVVAVVATADGARVDAVALRAHVAERLARYKAPRAVAFTDAVPRLANGKADYAAARDLAAGALDATAG